MQRECKDSGKDSAKTVTKAVQKCKDCAKTVQRKRKYTAKTVEKTVQLKIAQKDEHDRAHVGEVGISVGREFIAKTRQFRGEIAKLMVE